MTFEQDEYTLGVDLFEVSTMTVESVRLFHNEADTKAGELRQLLLSQGTGQGMVYQEKEREAREIKTQTSPISADFPLVAVDAELDNVSLSDAADTVILKAQVFKLVGAEIEKLRLGAKKGITNGASISSCQALIDLINITELASRLQAKGVDLYAAL